MRRLLRLCVVGCMLSTHVLHADAVVDAKTAVDAVTRLDGVVLTSVVCELDTSDELAPSNALMGAIEGEYTQCVVGNLADDVERIIADYLQVSVGVDDLLTMKNRLNQLYAVNGYINTGVQIPNQEITEGMLRLVLTPGRLLTMTIASDLRDRYITGRLRLNQPFNLVELQAQLKLLEQDQRITRIDARVEPTGVAGSAALDRKSVV